MRAIQEGEVEPVGARKPVKVDVRLISATNRDLIADVKAGRFREDLFYRLHVFPIAVPPLRERPEDIPELVRHFLARFAAEEGKRMSRVSAEALALLASHRWPGNVRQLENAVFRAVVLAEGDEVGVTEFPQIAAQVGGQLSVQQQVPLTASPDLASEAEAAPIAPLMLEPAAAGHPAPALAAAPAAALALLDRHGDVRAARRDRSRGHSLRDRALSRADVGSRATVADRTLDALPQARHVGSCGRYHRSRESQRCIRVTFCRKPME